MISLLHTEKPSWEALEASLAQAAYTGDGAEPVAALTGAILGLTCGAGAVPRHLIEHTEDHDHLIELGRALHIRAHTLDRATPPTTQEVDCIGGFTSSPHIDPQGPPALFADDATDASWAYQSVVQHEIDHALDDYIVY